MSLPERRLNQRLTVPGMSAALIENGSRRSRRVTVIDVSEDGMRWQQRTPIRRGGRIRLVIRTGRFFARTIHLEAIVVRSDADSAAARFLMGPERVELGSFLRARTNAGRQPSARAAADLTAAFGRLGLSFERSGSKTPRIIAVASARAGEGKSFVAAGIACALAAMGRRVLLVDANLESPTQHLRLFANGAPGLAHLLEDRRPPVSELVQRTECGVALMAAGAAGTISSFGPDAVDDAAAALRRCDYPLVILDGAPILTSADALLVSQIADDTLLTVRSGVTRERDVKQALELLQRNGTPALGIVLNDHVDLVNQPGRFPEALAVPGPAPLSIDTVPPDPAHTPEAHPAVPVGRLPV